MDDYCQESYDYEGPDISPETIKLKQKMTRLGGMIKNIETLDFNQQQSSPMNNSNAMAMVNKNIDPNRRETTRRNLGMFFGHENWNLIMNMMIGFRAGLKGYIWCQLDSCRKMCSSTSTINMWSDMMYAKSPSTANLRPRRSSSCATTLPMCLMTSAE